MSKILYILAGVLSVISFSANAQGEIKMENKNILIAYYSYSGNTKEVAEYIQKEIGGDLFEIKAEGAYPIEYEPMTIQAKKEIAENFRPKLLSNVKDLNKYNVVFIGSPNWWGTITPQVSSFIESNDLSGKIVVPFITHGGGGKQNTIKDLTTQCKSCDVSDNHWVGYGSRTLGISYWLKELGLKK